MAFLVCRNTRLALGDDFGLSRISDFLHIKERQDHSLILQILFHLIKRFDFVANPAIQRINVHLGQVRMDAPVQENLFSNFGQGVVSAKPLTVFTLRAEGLALLNEAQHPVWLDTGAEPIAGSTRMKAGTAQRVALTLLSSLVMIRLGRVYEGLMVDVQPSNRKLVRRSEAILAQLTGHSRDQVRDALRQAKGSVKLALLLLEGRSLDEARGALDTASGDLRAAKTLIEERRTQKKRA